VLARAALRTNFLWCLILIARNRIGRRILVGPCRSGRGRRKPPLLPQLSARRARRARSVVLPVLLLHDGESQMGRYSFSSWTVHMASIILFSTLWGFALKEWAGAAAARARSYGRASAR
jgi:L-rhamnose-H+ transport protein